MSKDIEFHKTFLIIAYIMAKRLSKCQSKQVGALFIKEGRIISTGINGTPSGLINCCDAYNKNDIRDSVTERDHHHEFSKANEVHAEMNGILYAARNSISIEGCDVYCTLQPCNECIKNLVGLGIKNIYYYQKYDKSEWLDYNKILLEEVNLIQIDIGDSNEW